MPFSRNIIPSSFLVAFAALALISSGTACNNADFASGNSKSGIGLKDGKPGSDANDGGDTDSGTDSGKDGGNDSGNSGDSDSDGGNDSGGGKDSGIDGNDSGDSDSDGIDGSDSGDSDGGDLGTDSGETTKKTRSDLKIVQTREDDKHRVKVELLIKGKVSKFEEIASPGKGKTVMMKDMCRIGLDTCVRVTFIGKLTQVAGGAQCVFTSPISATSVKLDVDVNGAGFLGSCKPDEDETYNFSCDESKSLKVQGCNG